MSLAENLKSTTIKSRDAKAKAAAEVAAAAERKAKSDKAKGVKSGRELYLSEVKPGMERAAKDGENTFSYDIFQYWDSPEWTDFHRGMVESMTKAAKADGITAETRSGCLRSTGSDPLFPNTVYSLYLDFSW